MFVHFWPFHGHPAALVANERITSISSGQNKLISRCEMAYLLSYGKWFSMGRGDVEFVVLGWQQLNFN